MEINIKKKNLTVILHIALWLLVFLWPLLSLNDSSQLDRIIVRNWLPTVCMVILFYINYFVLIDRFFFEKRKIIFAVINLILIIGFFFIIDYISQQNIAQNPLRGIEGVRNLRRDSSIPSIRFILPMILSIGMCIGIKLNSHWNKKELLIQKIKQTQLNSEIKYLRHQVQPHFLFNTLNNIYALVDSSPETAKTSIHSLSKMMRYLLHESATNRVPLAKEIDFLERYVALMQLRVPTNLKLMTKFPVINQPIQIAPLLLLTFIENAFKHGIDATLPSYININLSIQNDAIHYSVENSSFPENNGITDSGIGLINLRKRLDLLYPDNFQLTEDNFGSSYKAELIINLLNND